jgi:putative serine protease PepD
MSDELFWPPLSSGAKDDRDAQGTASGDAATGSDDATAATSELPTHAPGEHPTEPLPGSWTGGPPSPPSYGEDLTGGPQGPRRRRNSAVALVAVTAFVFGAGGVGLGAALVNHDNDNDNVTTSNAGLTVASGSPSSLATSPKSLAGIAARLLPSVVSVNVKGQQESDTGSGIVLRQDGYILTNNHVVAAAANGKGTVSATFQNGSNVSARIVGTDSLDDLAVIKVAKTGLKPVTLGSDAAVKVGDPVLAVGSPLGLSGTVTSGIVSALNRPVVTSDDTQPTDPFGGSGGGTQAATNPTVIDAIQTDAAINPGNSGGPLVNSAGAVIGINSAIASLGSDSTSGSQSGNIGVGFAIPIDEAKTIATELITTGKAVHPLLGVTLTDKASSSGADQAIVHSVSAGGPAAKAGLKAGDVITAINSAATAGDDAVIAAIRSHQPGQTISVTYQRGGSSHTVQVTLTQQSSSD